MQQQLHQINVSNFAGLWHWLNFRPERNCSVRRVYLVTPNGNRCFNPHQPTLYEPPHDKTNKMTVCPAKTQIGLGIRPVWPESSLCAQWVANDPHILHADSEDSDQPGRMARLIWVFAGRSHFVCFVIRRLIYSLYVLQNLPLPVFVKLYLFEVLSIIILCTHISIYMQDLPAL